MNRKMSNTRRRRGATLIEVMMTVTLFSLVSMVLYASLHQGTSALRTLNAQTDAQKTLRVADYWLTLDLQQASQTQIARKRISTSAGNGDVIWFLSAVDPTVQGPNAHTVVRDPNAAAPLWQRNVIYYCIRSSDHNTAEGQVCGTDPNPLGDAYCPHKFLIRKVVKMPGTPQTLLTAAQVDAYTTKPNGFDTTVFAGEPNLESTKIISNHVLWFSSTQPSAEIFTVDTKSVRLAEAKRLLSIGSIDLSSNRFTLNHVVTFPLMNP